MAINQEDIRSSFSGDGSTVAFPTGFEFFDAADLRVVLVDALGAETVKALTTHYTVSGGDGATGTVTMLTAPASGETLTVVNDAVEETTLDLIEGGEFPPDDVETALDRCMAVAARAKDIALRCIRLRDGNTESGALLEMQETSAQRASKFLACDSSGQVIASAGTPTSDVIVSAFGQTLVDDANASAAQTTLGMSTYFKTLLASATAATLRTLLGFAGSGGTVQAANVEDATLTGAKMVDNTISKRLLDTTTTLLAGEIGNVGLACSVGSSALTITLTDAAGATPSAASPISVVFRNATLTNGTSTQLRIATTKTLVVPSTGTLGHTSAKEHDIHVYALNFSGALELALSSTLLDEGKLQTTAAIASSPNSLTGIYSTTARTSVPVTYLGRLRSTQTTAGTWAAVPTEVYIGRPRKPPAQVLAHRSGADITISDSTVTTIVFDGEDWDPNGCYDPSTGIFTADEEGMHLLGGSIFFADTASFNGTTEYVRIGYDLNSGSSQVDISGLIPPTGTANLVYPFAAGVYLKKGDTLKIYVKQTSGANMSIFGAGQPTNFWIKKAA